MFTYALSRLRAQTYLVRTKLPWAHKPYTYAISRLRTQVVLYVRNKSLYAQKLYILRKVAYRAHKPYNLRTLSLQVILTNRQDFSKKNLTLSFPFLHLPSLSTMRSEQAKSSWSSRGEAKKHTSTIAPISLEDLMDKEKPYVYVRIQPYIVRISRTSYAQVALSA